MKIKDTIITVIAVALLGLLGYVWFSPAGIGTAPEIKFTTLDNQPLTLQSLKGRPVLITFWATSCTGCIEEMPHLVELHNKLAPKGLAIIGISMAYDPPNHVTELVKRRQLPYTIAMDIDGSASRAFGNIKLTPTTFLIAPDGRIVLKKIGDLDMAALTKRIEYMLNAKLASR